MRDVSLSVILMVHNEEETIGEEIKSYYQKIIKKAPNSEFIIAEDGSTDNTRKIIYESAKKIPMVLLVTPRKRGYAKSLLLALKKAKGKLILYADAGGKHDPADFWKLYAKIKTYDLVNGYKKNRQDPRYRLFLAWGLNTSVSWYFGVKCKDIDSGFKLMRKNVRDRLMKAGFILKNNISLEIVLKTAYNGFRLTEVPITHFGRKFGSSRGIPPKKIAGIVINLLLTFPKLKESLIIE